MLETLERNGESMEKFTIGTKLKKEIYVEAKKKKKGNLQTEHLGCATAT